MKTFQALLCAILFGWIAIICLGSVGLIVAAVFIAIAILVSAATK